MDLSNAFADPNATGTLVELVFVISGTNPVLSGTKRVNVLLSDRVTPVTVANFLGYEEVGYYDSSIIHRSSPGFVIQGGGYNVSGTNIYTVPQASPIKNEAGATNSNLRGTIAMAQSGDPDSATNQWFINLADNTDLDSQHFTVFGRVVSGMNVIDAIAGIPVYNRTSVDPDFYNLPLTDDGKYVILKSTRIVGPFSSVAAVSNHLDVANLPAFDDGVLTLHYGDPGASTVTVTGTDVFGLSASTAFDIHVVPQTATLVEFALSDTRVSEKAASVALTVKRTGAIGPFTVNFATSNGFATAGQDYVKTTGKLSFARTDATKTIKIPILNNTAFNTGKWFEVTLSNPTNGVLIASRNTSMVDILEDDTNPHGVIQLSGSNYVADGGNHYMRINVTRTGGTSGTASAVFLTMDYSAITGYGYGYNDFTRYDYNGSTRRVSFGPGDNTPIPIFLPVADRHHSGTPLFSIGLMAPQDGATIGPVQTAVGSIRNTASGEADISFSSSEYRVAGKNKGAIVIVRRFGSLTSTASATVSMTNGSGIAGTNYTARSGIVSFLPNEGYKAISIAISPDSVDRTVKLHLSNPSPATALGEIHDATLVIGQTVTAKSVAFSGSNYRLAGRDGTGQVVVLRTGNKAGSVYSFMDVLSNNAALGTDFLVGKNDGLEYAPIIHVASGATSGTLAISSGTSRAITEKSIDLLMYSSSQGSSVGALNLASVTLCAIDAPAGAFEFSTSGTNVRHTAGQVLLTVRRSNTSGPANVTISASNGTAKAGVDYRLSPNSISFANGESTKTLSIPLIRRAVPGTAKKSFTVALSFPSTGAFIGVQDKTTVVIGP